MFRFSILHLLLLFSSNETTQKQTEKRAASVCKEHCGELLLPYPFHLSPSCAHADHAFRLSCRKYYLTQKKLLFLTLNSTISIDLLVRDFFPETGTLVVDLPRDHFLLSESSVFQDTPFPFYAVLPKDNVVKLYDCHDSTVCKMRCFGGNGCCYPLKDGSVWKIGDGFSVFSHFGCRGFSTWVVAANRRWVRGIEIEWAVPRGSANRSVCADGAIVVNATAVDNGVRCKCSDGLTGDGFTDGMGCVDGRLPNKNKRSKTTLISAAVLVIISAMTLAAFLVTTIRVFCRVNNNKHKTNAISDNIFAGGRHGIRVFDYQQLFHATGGFNDAHKLIDDIDETVHIGELDDDNMSNTTVAVQKLKCQTEQVLFQVLHLVGKLSQASHRNVARVLGFCIDPNVNTVVLIVHEFARGCTLEDHLQRRKRAPGLKWSARLNIALEVASALAWVQSQLLHPQLSIQDLRSTDILLKLKSSRLNCFKILSLSRYSDIILRSSPTTYTCHTVYDYGFLLMEIIVGRRHEHLPNLIWPKMCSGDLQEVVDPYIGYHRLSPTEAKQVDRVIDLATQCLLSGQSNGVCCMLMDDVVRELASIYLSTS